MTRRLAPRCFVSVLAFALNIACAQQHIVDVRQGTDIAIAVSPDREALVIDLLGQLWRLPATGGGAVQLTPPGDRAKNPRFSPDGRYVVYQRLIDGHWDLWLVELDSGARRALTETPYDERQPDFLDDGNVVYASNLSGEYALWALEIATGRQTQLTSERGDASFPTVSDDGAIAYVREEAGVFSLRSLSRASGNVELFSSELAIGAPSWRPGGGVIIFNQTDHATSSQLRMLLLSDIRVMKTLAAGEDIYAVRPAWLSPSQYLYAADGQIWRRGIGEKRREPVHLFAGVAVDVEPSRQFRAEFDNGELQPARGTPGRTLAPQGDRQVFSALGDLWLADEDGVRQLTDDRFVDVDPAWSPDGSAVVFASDRGGAMNIWSLDLESGELERITSGAGKAYHPSISGTGSLLAYLETDGFGPWAPSTLHLLDLPSRTVIASSRDTFLGAETPRWRSQEADTLLEIVAKAPSSGADRQLIELDATLAVQGRRPLTVSDSAAAVQPASLTARPEWRRRLPQQRYVIQAGRLFDGTSGSYRRHVDIHIDGNRISAIVGRGVLPLPDAVIDVQDLTVLPGFVDVHVHQSSLAGERLGRIWLAHGVTTVREIGDDPLDGIERSETWASGRQLGPRLLVSPTSSLLMNLDAASDSDFLAPALNRRLLNGPVHSEVTELTTSTETLRSISAMPIAPQAQGFDFRSSPLQAQYQDVFSTILEAGYVTGTAIGAMRAFGGEAQSAFAKNLGLEAFKRLYSANEQALWLAAGTRGGSIKPRQDRIARLIRSGARVAIGTDAPVVPYGLGLQSELSFLAEAGIPNDQILRIATMEGALALGLDREIGSVEDGKLADLLVVEGDPLARITDAAQIRAVVLGGTWIDSSALFTASE